MDDIEKSAADSAQCYLASGIMHVAWFLNPRFFESSEGIQTKRHE